MQMPSNQPTLLDGKQQSKLSTIRSCLSISKLHPGRTAIKSRWVFKIKPGVRDSRTRYKAVQVAKGFSQRSGIDYGKTVVKYDTLRIILSFVAAQNLKLSQLDIKTAFLYGELDGEIYHQQPKGFIISGKETSVCHLYKCPTGSNRRREYGTPPSMRSSENLDNA